MKWSSLLPDFSAFPVDSLTERLGWCVLHFFWQGTLAAIGLALLLRLCRRGTADLRHACCALALGTMAMAPVLTWIQLTPIQNPSIPSGTMTPVIVSVPSPLTLRASASPPEMTGLKTPPGGPAVLIASLEERSESSTSDAAAEPGTAPRPNWRAWLGLAWLIGAACLALTKLCGLGLTFYLIRQAVPAEGAILDQAQLMARRCRLKRLPRLKILNRLRSPAVAGIFRPVLLIPSGALAGLSPREMDFILAHEFSHIQRHDYLAGLLQAAVETLLFFHPAVWWVSRRMNLERELACDDRARHLTGNPRAAATALARLAELSLEQAPALAPAAATQPLLHRIQRLLSPVPNRRRSFPVLVAPAVSLLLLVPLLPLSAARETNAREETATHLTEPAKAIPESPSAPARSANSATSAPDSAATNTDKTAATLPENPTTTILRGGITDRNGIVLAESTIATRDRNGEAITGELRHYPLAALTSHVIGYAGQTPHQSTPARKVAGDAGAGDATGSPRVTGLAGVEKSMDALLREKPAAENKSTPTIALTLDARMQQICRQALMDAGVGRGAAVLLDVSNGDILSMVSVPDFDPNQLVSFSVRENDVTSLRTDRTEPLVNRALMAYPRMAGKFGTRELFPAPSPRGNGAAPPLSFGTICQQKACRRKTSPPCAKAWTAP